MSRSLSCICRISRLAVFQQRGRRQLPMFTIVQSDFHFNQRQFCTSPLDNKRQSASDSKPKEPNVGTSAHTASGTGSTKTNIQESTDNGDSKSSNNVQKSSKSFLCYMRDLQKATSHFIMWVFAGTKLFCANLRISVKLLTRKCRGHQLTLRENKLLLRTMADLIKLMPFLVMIMIPFAELLLPVALRLNPKLLPSTFFVSPEKKKKGYLAAKLKARQELAVLFQELVFRRTQSLVESDSKYADKAEELQEYQKKLMCQSDASVPFLSLSETMRFASLFKEEFNLDNMSLTTIKSICDLLGLKTYGVNIKSSMVIYLRHHVSKLQREDKQILWEGVDSLTHEELMEACKARAMIFFDVTDDGMRRELSHWLELSSKDISPVLLIWSRCITMTHQPVAKLSDKEAAHTPPEPPQPELDNEETPVAKAAEKYHEKRGDATKRLNELREEEKEMIEEDKSQGSEHDKEKIEINDKEKIEINDKEKIEINDKEKIEINDKEKIEINDKEKRTPPS